MEWLYKRGRKKIDLYESYLADICLFHLKICNTHRDPIISIAQCASVIYTLCVFVCECGTKPLNRCVTKVADAYFYSCRVM